MGFDVVKTKIKTTLNLMVYTTHKNGEFGNDILLF